MGMTRVDWNVVVAGKWNPAIFTPAAVAKKLFEQEQGTPVEVMVPLDFPGRPLIKFEGVSVTVSASRLVAQSDVHDFDGIVKAKALASRAVSWLSETPLTAAGINVRYQTDSPSDGLTELLTHDCDAILPGLEMTIQARGLRRAIEWADGQINIDISSSPGDGGKTNYIAAFNFHFPSTDPNALVAWLDQPIDDIKRKSETLLAKYIKETVEVPDDNG